MSAMKLFGFNTATRSVDKRSVMLMYGANQQTDIYYPFYLIDHSEGNVLFDTGVSYELINDPHNYGIHGSSHLADYASTVRMDKGNQPAIQLESIGYPPESIDFVILSHLHVDHAGSISAFDDSTFIVQLSELRYAWWPENPVQRDFYIEGDFHVLRSPDMNVMSISGGYDVFGDGTVVCIPTPGHTPGHQSLKLSLEDFGNVILAGDVAHLREGYESHHLPPFNWNMAEAIKSLKEVKQLSHAEKAKTFILHEPDDFDRIPDPPDYIK